MPQEKLIDDVVAFICEHGIVAQGYVGFRREDAKQLIARIVEGPLPEEVGRITAEMLGGGSAEVIHVREGDALIVLRPLSGTKEEEE